MSPVKHAPGAALIRALETFLTRFVTFANPDTAFVAALWILGTYLWPDFDTYPYLVITSDVKRSGKTRFAELLSFVTLRGRLFTSVTAASLFQTIKEEQPTIFIDEAEKLGSETARAEREILNAGYRRGSSVPRWSKQGRVEWPTYCPKVFILIGDVFDTLRDRSIILRMWRGEPKERFFFAPVMKQGAELQIQISDLLGVSLLVPDDPRDPARLPRREPTATTAAIYTAYQTGAGLDFLFDRDEEIWSPLFAIARVLCPERVAELRRIAVDFATEKTQEARDHKALHNLEKLTENDEYAERLLRDMALVFKADHGERTKISTVLMIEALKGIPTAPWRKYRGDGLSPELMASLLKRFGIAPALFKARGKVARGYKREEIQKAVAKL